MLEDKGYYIQLDVVVENYRTKSVFCKNPDGTHVVVDGQPVKEETREYIGFNTIPTSFLKSGITLYGPVRNGYNKLLKTRANIFDSYTDKFYTVKHRPEAIESILKHRAPIGFQIPTKK